MHARSFLAFTLLIANLLILAPLKSVKAQSIDPKGKVLGSVVGFGVVGGALLGMASKAFDNSDSFGRATAKGASIGLYAGLLFGGYILISHAYEQRQVNKGDKERFQVPADTTIYRGEDAFDNTYAPESSGGGEVLPAAPAQYQAHFHDVSREFAERIFSERLMGVRGINGVPSTSTNIGKEELRFNFNFLNLEF